MGQHMVFCDMAQSIILCIIWVSIYVIATSGLGGCLIFSFFLVCFWVGVGGLLSIVERQFMIFSSFRLSGVPFLVEDD